MPRSMQVRTATKAQLTSQKMALEAAHQRELVDKVCELAHGHIDVMAQWLQCYVHVSGASSPPLKCVLLPGS